VIFWCQQRDWQLTNKCVIWFLQVSPSKNSFMDKWMKFDLTLRFVVSGLRIPSNPSSGAHTWADKAKVQTTFSKIVLWMNGLLKRYQSWFYLNFEGMMPVKILKKAFGLRFHRSCFNCSDRSNSKWYLEVRLMFHKFHWFLARTKLVPFFERFGLNWFDPI
jgi:hypothetical protein